MVYVMVYGIWSRRFIGTCKYIYFNKINGGLGVFCLIIEQKKYVFGLYRRIFIGEE